jgi:hypothetical protein
MILDIFTLFHVLISLVAIASGFVVLFGLIHSERRDSWTSVFLTTTAATSITGFMFPFHGLTPGIVVGILSVILLAIAIPARYHFRLAGAWRGTYVITATLALYFNVFVLVVQLFRRVPALKALAPTQSEPPFAVVQLAVLVLFLVLGTLATTRFRTEPLRAA